MYTFVHILNSLRACGLGNGANSNGASYSKDIPIIQNLGPYIRMMYLSGQLLGYTKYAKMQPGWYLMSLNVNQYHNRFTKSLIEEEKGHILNIKYLLFNFLNFAF